MQKRRFRSILATFIPCFLFWLLLTMSIEPRELLGGLVVCGITAWFSSGFFVQNEATAFKMFQPKRVLMLLYFFFVVFMWEVLKANWAMAVAVFTNKQPKQAIIKVPVRGITNYYALAVLADCITLTPGTITLDVSREGKDEYYMYVQWLMMETDDPEEAGEIIKGRMERWIRRIWA